MSGSMISELFDLFGQRATVHLDTDAIATLFSAPTLIVPAPGPGMMIVLTGGLAQYVPISGTWDFMGTHPRVFYGPDAPPDPINGFAASAQITSTLFAGGAMTLVASADDGTEPSPVSVVEDAPLIVSCQLNPTGPAEGDLYVTVFYAVVDLH